MLSERGSAKNLLPWLGRAFSLISLLWLLLVPSTVSADTPIANERTGVSGDSNLPALNLHNSASDAPRLGPGRLTVPGIPAGYNRFDGGWIQFHYHPSSRERVEALIAESTKVRQELSEWLGVPVLQHVRVDIARTPGEMATLAPPGAPYPEYAAGVAYSEIGLVLLTLTPVHPTSDHDLVQVFRHELAHIALHDAVAGSHVPRWFNEGFAVLASGETSFTRLQTLWLATVGDHLLPLEQLDASFPANEADAGVAYAEAVDVVRYLLRKREHFRFQGLVERVRAGSDFAVALRQSYGIELTELEQEWREDVAKRYTFWPVLFSGSAIWMGTFGLFFVGWRKRRQRSKKTLARWEQEEAREDMARIAASEAAQQRVHIVLARNNPPPMPMIPPPAETEVPKVEHDGQWHTLH